MKCTALILKVASRCNLNCDYCYVYNVGDDSYLSQPKLMSQKVVDSLLQQVALHCQKHQLTYFEFIFHGGEPLLAPISFYQQFIEKAKETLSLSLGFSLQTNGILINDDWVRFLIEHDINIGISIDVSPQVHDLHRVTHTGRGSYQATLNGLRALQNAPLKYRVGVLMVIDITADPLAVYEHIKELGIKNINLLLPYGNYEKPPFGEQKSKTPLADWLIPIFDAWFWDNQAHFEIKLFRQIMELIMGIDNGFENWGQRKNEFLVIETDGSVEAVGALKLCGNGFTKAGINVTNNTLDDALDTHLAQQYQLSHRQICSTCRQCEVVAICGGGFFPNRYKASNGFDNPSVYCADLYQLIVHIQNRMLDDMPEEFCQLGIQKLAIV